MIQSFSHKLITWYKLNKRDLPWRNTDDPYKIWISEIILQQTRVTYAIDYYNKFIEKFPTIDALSDAKEDEVLNSWQGLGYYSRARNIHHTSKKLKEKYSSNFPNKYDEIIKLKGIGRYTAGAILSFAFKKKYPVVDGNVFRFFSRIFFIDKFIDTKTGQNYFYDVAEDLICEKNPDLFNQAIIEYGAMVCKPKKPTCTTCIFNQECKAHKKNKVFVFPRKKNKLKTTDRFLIFFLGTKKNIYLKKKKDGIWKGLYIPPLYEAKSKKELNNIKKNEDLNIFNNNVKIQKVSKVIHHKLTHQNLSIKFCYSDLDLDNQNEFVKVKLKNFDHFPVPIVIEKFLKNFYNEQKK